jgi:hypothetical protein
MRDIGNTRSTTGTIRPAPTSRQASRSSPVEPIVEPSTESCLKNTARRSSPTRAPDVAPQVTSRPPQASARSEASQVSVPTLSTTTSTFRAPIAS